MQSCLIIPTLYILMEYTQVQIKTIVGSNNDYLPHMVGLR